MRLVHVSTIAESLRAFRDQMAFMQQQGVDVHAVAAQSPYAEQLEFETTVPIHRVGLRRPVDPLRDFASLRELTRLFRKLQPDIVHAHTPKGGLLGMWAARAAHVPVRIYHLRGLRFATEASWRRSLLRRCERSACSSAHEVLSVSHSLRYEAIREGLVDANRIKVLENGGHGLDAAHRFNPAMLPPGTREATRNQWKIPLDACVIGFVGRMVLDKGIRELWSAWRTLRKAHAHLHLLLVGPREAEYPLPSDIRSAIDADARVHCTGADYNTPPLYASMDIACLPSYREGLPKMPLEAAAMNLPVVTTDATGCVDSIIPNYTGLLVPTADALALTQALEQYIIHAALREKHGRAGRAWVMANFPPDRIHRAMLEEYLRLRQEAGRSQPLDTTVTTTTPGMPRRVA